MKRPTAASILLLIAVIVLGLVWPAAAQVPASFTAIQVITEHDGQSLSTYTFDPTGGAKTEIDLPAGGRLVVVASDQVEALAQQIAALRTEVAQLTAKIDALPTPIAPPPAGLLVDLDAATLEELDRSLPYVGPATAAAIVQLRDLKGGRFDSPFDLTSIRGLTSERIQDWIDQGLLVLH
jgi:DNA uptake protein ComE-like DNA-binding protein